MKKNYEVAFFTRYFFGPFYSYFLNRSAHYILKNQNVNSDCHQMCAFCNYVSNVKEINSYTKSVSKSVVTFLWKSREYAGE
jgi:wyosine [tRNA(Phe)-imidazoG37] synthetase (radical SAM superfamily)